MTIDLNFFLANDEILLFYFTLSYFPISTREKIGGGGGSNNLS